MRRGLLLVILSLFTSLQLYSQVAGTTNYVAKFTSSNAVGNSAIYESGGKVGIGTTTPQAALDVNGTSIIFRSPITTFTTANTFGPQFAFTNNASPTPASWRFGIPGAANSTSFFIYDYVSKNSPFTLEKGAGANALYLKSGGLVGIGTATPGSKLTVAGTVESTTGGFKFPDATIQTTAATGTITGVTPGFGLVGGGTSGNVGLSLAPVCTNQVLVWNGSQWACQNFLGGSYLPLSGGTLTGNLAGTTATFGAAISPPQYVVAAVNTAAGPANTEQGPPDPNQVPAAVVGLASPVSGISAGVIGKGVGTASVGVVGITDATGAPAMVAWNTNTTGGGDGLEAMVFGPDSTAVRARSYSGTAGAPALSSETVATNAFAGEFNNLANGNMLQVGNGMTTKFMVQGNQTTINTSTYIGGNLSVNGSISKQSGSFKIDHPLDPTNKYLSHSFVESPDMKNIYDGVAVLDSQGEAWITLPDYFGALNSDFRYQLTAIGASMPKLFVAQEVANNRFKIAGGKAGAKVSWQVTGVREDAWAKAHRIQVEEPKTGTERGTYMNPELYGHAGETSTPARK